MLVASLLPQSLRPADTIAYAGDSLESVYIVAWNVHQAFSSPLQLFDANALHPVPRALALTDHRLLPSLLVAPVLWATDNPVLAYNAALAAGLLLAAFAARRLAQMLGADALAAWAAGALYAFHTYQINEAPRLNIVFHGFLPLALAELVRYLRSGAPRRAWTTAGWMLLQGLSSNYHLLYGSLLTALILVGTAMRRPRLVAERLPRLALAAGTAALLFSPIAWPYLDSAARHGYERALPRGIDLAHYLSTSPTNLLYGAIGVEVRLQQQGPHFVGFVSLALAGAALGAALLRRGHDSPDTLLPSRVWVPAAASLAALMVLLSLGSDISAFGVPLGPGPYRLLYELVPGFRLVRIPERFALLAMLFVALLVARGLMLLRARAPLWLLVAASLAVPLEHLSPLPLSERVPVAERTPAVYDWLAEQPVSALAELPVRGDALVRLETLDMYFSTRHFAPIVSGYTAFPPLITRVLRRAAAEFPAPGSIQVLQRAGVDTVVVHHGRSLGADLFNQTQVENEALRRAEHARLLRVAQLDLYDRLPRAVAEARIERLARFAGPAARLYDSTLDEVYRIPATPEVRAAPFPEGVRRRDPGWRYRTKRGDPLPATDADGTTDWVVPGPLRGDEFFEVVFGNPLRVSGLVLRLHRDSAFPSRFRIGARDDEGHWREVARYDAPHALQLLEDLLAGDPLPRIGFALGAVEVTGLSVLVEEGGTSHEGWRIPEIEVLTP